MPNPSPSRIASSLLAQTFRFIPSSRRFDAAMAASRALRPLIRRSRFWRDRRQLGTDGVAETSLDLLLTALTRCGVTFQPRIDVRQPGGTDWRDNGRPTLIIGPHRMLLRLVLCHLTENGHVPPVGVSVEPIEIIPGTRRSIETLTPGPDLFFRIRRYLLEGRTVCAMIDRADEERRTIRAGTARTMLISDAVVRLALRCDAQIVFMSAHIDGDSVALTLDALPEANDVESVIASFAEFCAAQPQPRD